MSDANQTLIDELEKTESGDTDMNFSPIHADDTLGRALCDRIMHLENLTMI